MIVQGNGSSTGCGWGKKYMSDNEGVLKSPYQKVAEHEMRHGAMDERKMVC